MDYVLDAMLLVFAMLIVCLSMLGLFHLPTDFAALFNIAGA